MTDAVPLDTGDIDDIERLRGSSDHVFLTCPQRVGACAYQHGPDRPDDYGLLFLLDFPYCVNCGCSLEIVPRSAYDGPEHQFRALDAPAGEEAIA